jgi:excisionase family DNA binding protein
LKIRRSRKVANFITNKEAAARLGISKQRVWQLIQSGKLPAQKVGRDWIIEKKVLERPEIRDRKPGRPRK